MPSNSSRNRLSPSERADRCASHREATSPTDAKAFRLLAELIHGLEDLTLQVEGIAQSQAAIQSALDANSKAIAELNSRIG